MSNIVTQSLSTVPATPTAPAAPSGSEDTAPPVEAESGGASVVEGKPTPPEGDKSLELAKRWDAVSAREGKAKKLEREAQTRLASLSEKEKALEAKMAELDEALSDPVGYMLKTGKDPVAIAERYAKPETEEEKRIRRIEENLAKREKEDERRAKEAEEKQRADARFATLKGFVGSITPDECPNLTSLYEAREVPRLVDELLNRPQNPRDPESPTMFEAFVEAHGRNPTDAEIRDCLEYEAELRANKILERHRASQRQEAATSQPRPGAPKQDSSKSERGPSGISNQHAAVTTTARTKPLSREEQRKKNREELTAALEAEAGD